MNEGEQKDLKNFALAIGVEIRNCLEFVHKKNGPFTIKNDDKCMGLVNRMIVNVVYQYLEKILYGSNEDKWAISMFGMFNTTTWDDPNNLFATKDMSPSKEILRQAKLEKWYKDEIKKWELDKEKTRKETEKYIAKMEAKWAKK